MSDIFISYASSDREKAKTIAHALEKNNWSVWWDRKIPPGKTFAQVIKEALDAAKCVVVLWSSESAKSDWVLNETAEGSSRKVLVPALIEDVEIPFEFRRIQAARLIDWSPKSPHAEFEEFVSSIGIIIGHSAKSEKFEKADELQEETEQLIAREIPKIPVKVKSSLLNHNPSIRWIATTLAFIVTVSVGWGAGFFAAAVTGAGDTAGWIGAISTWFAGLVVTYKVWHRFSKS